MRNTFVDILVDRMLSINQNHKSKFFTIEHWATLQQKWQIAQEYAQS